MKGIEPITAAIEKLVRKKEAAAILACSTRSIDRLVSMGKLSRVKVMGVGVRYRLSQIQNIVNGGAA